MPEADRPAAPGFGIRPHNVIDLQNQSSSSICFGQSGPMGVLTRGPRQAVFGSPRGIRKRKQARRNGFEHHCQQSGDRRDHFFALLIVWFVAVYTKRRVGPDQHASGAVPPKSASWDEKRRRARVSVSWQASVESGAGSVRAQVRDVSQGGAFVVCNPPLALKSRLVVTLAPADREPLGLNAEVVWSNANVPADKIINRGMGIRFIDNDETVRNRLNQLLVGCLNEDC